jgi:L-aspartate oxidase
MWDYVGIVRTTKRLKRAKHRIDMLTREIEEFYANFRVSHDLIELRNLVATADLIVRCALRRKESRGLHYSRDYPEMNTKIRDTVIKGRQATAHLSQPANAGKPAGV